jgi:cell division FtsZ-interacting protein ZapD
MFVHVALSILGLSVLTLQLLLLGRLQRFESLLQTMIAVQLDLAQKMLTEITGVETTLSIRLTDQEGEEESTPKPEHFSLQSEIDRFVSGNMYGEEDD